MRDKRTITSRTLTNRNSYSYLLNISNRILHVQKFEVQYVNGRIGRVSRAQRVCYVETCCVAPEAVARDAALTSPE